MDERRNSDSNNEIKNNYIDQFASSVTEFSSQYGKENAHSYTASNLAHGYSKYPSYGDYSECFVLRTYGKWWSILQSGMRKPVKDEYGFISKDFVELKYNQKVIVDSVSIYETYNPGSTVAIYAFSYISSRWICIWSIFHENNYKSNYEALNRQLPPKTSRNFCPLLTRRDVFSDLIRLEFSDWNQEYYVELDAVEIFGYTHEHYLIARTVASNMNEICSDFEDLIKNEHENKATVNVDQQNDESSITRPPSKTQTLLTGLPHEVLNLILRNLDLLTLLKLRSTCKIFYNICSDKLLFNQLDLQPYWYLVNESFIQSIKSLANHITLLSLSWTKSLKFNQLNELLSSSYTTLTTLKLASCQYIDNESLMVICKNCVNLEELDLQSNRQVTSFKCVNQLKNLKKLNLYRTQCENKSLISIVSECLQLEYLNLGSCVEIADMDELLTAIATHNPNIKGLDLWRASTLKVEGLTKIAESCLKLEEIDIGWCKLATYDCLHLMIKNCQQLKKLFLTALRISDQELKYISTYSDQLEQLDILGSNLVSLACVENVLRQCKYLKFLDVSFCSKIDAISVKSLSQIYPNCSIKKSFQSE